MKPYSFHSSPTKLIKKDKGIKETNTKPSHPAFYREETINWFRNRYPESLVKKSISSLLPNNVIPIKKEKQKNMAEIIQYLNKSDDDNKNKNININPKYFYSRDLFNKILKLKEIFLQFDEDGSRKMEIDEMVHMFKINHIDITEEDLRRLFFKENKYKKQDKDKLELDFYQFMQFALNKNSDQDYRQFMRKVKEKIGNEKKIEEDKVKKINKINKMYGNYNEDDSMVFDKSKIPIYLPMNFNLVMDYFIVKGKERASHKIIRRGIKRMKNIITPGTYPDDDSDLNITNDQLKNNNNKNVSPIKEHRHEHKDSNDNNDDHDKDKEIRLLDQKELDEYAKQLKEINTKEILDEFGKLFKVNYTISSNQERDKTNSQEKSISYQQILDQKDKTINSYNRIPFQKKNLSNYNSVVNLRQKALSPNIIYSSPDRAIQKNKPINNRKGFVFTEMLHKPKNNLSTINLKTKKLQSIRLGKDSINNYFSKDSSMSSPIVDHKSIHHQKIKSMMIPSTSSTKDNWRLPRIMASTNTNANSITSNSTVSKNFLACGHL